MHAEDLILDFESTTPAATRAVVTCQEKTMPLSPHFSHSMPQAHISLVASMMKIMMRAIKGTLIMKIQAHSHQVLVTEDCLPANKMKTKTHYPLLKPTT
jgi:hypothetical protein